MNIKWENDTQETDRTQSAREKTYHMVTENTGGCTVVLQSDAPFKSLTISG